MNVEGKLVSPEFADCTLPLTAIIRGEKVRIGYAHIHYDGLVDATLDNKEVLKFLTETKSAGRFAIRLNPEVRIEAVQPAETGPGYTRGSLIE